MRKPIQNRNEFKEWPSRFLEEPEGEAYPLNGLPLSAFEVKETWEEIRRRLGRGDSEVMKMTEVFVVTAGAYSDFHIVAVFSTEELAENYRKRYPDSDAATEKYQVDEPRLVSQRPYFQVKIGYDLTVQEIEPATPKPEEIRLWIGEYGFLTILTCGDDEQHAIKIAMEKAREYKADSENSEHWLKFWEHYAACRKEET